MELTFSKMTVDTSLAKEYVKGNKALTELYNDYEGNVKKGTVSYGGVFKKVYETYSEEEIQSILWNLAASLKQNSELIVQLEYHFRNIPVEDTKAQLSVLIQYFNSCSKIWLEEYKGYSEYLTFGDYLLHLTNVGILMLWNSHITLRASTKEHVAICHLFVTLCREAGWLNIHLECSDNNLTTNGAGLKHGAVAVVSEDADLDSAVDKFLSSSKQVPWYLRRVLVQESVYKQFKDALNWKCSLKKNENNPVLPSALCSQALTYEGRTFLIDPVEVVEEKQSVITIEAYRTTKEMISMLQQDEPYYLSLWINGIAQINEVTQSTKSSVVWVNNIGDIRGPPHVGRTLYPSFVHQICYVLSFDDKNDKILKLVKLSKPWSKLDLESRRDILINVLRKCIPFNSTLVNDYNSVRNSVMNFTNESFVQAGKDYTCRGIWTPVDFIAIPGTKLSFSLVVNLVLQGNALVVCEDAVSEKVWYPKLLEEAGVPVVTVKECRTGNFKAKKYCEDNGTRSLQVIWTNSGTIFAN